jgi:uncharacterized protein
MQRKEAWQHGVAPFNSGRFFEAHEVLEDVWREAPRHGQLRQNLQALVQLAVAFHHQSTGNLDGARSVLERALRNLKGAEDSFPELDMESLQASLSPWRDYLARLSGESLTEAGGCPLELPKLRLRVPKR